MYYRHLLALIFLYINFCCFHSYAGTSLSYRDLGTGKSEIDVILEKKVEELSVDGAKIVVSPILKNNYNY